MLKYKCKRCGKIVQTSPFDPLIGLRVCEECKKAIDTLQRTGGKNRATRRAEAKQRRKFESAIKKKTQQTKEN